MSKLSENPFDYHDTKRPLVSLMVHSNSLGKRLITGSILCEQLFGLMEYDAVAVFLSPTDDEQLKAKAQQNGWKLANFQPEQGFIDISRGRVHTYDMAEMERMKITPFHPDSAYSHWDHLGLLAEEFHFYIVEEDDSIFASSNRPESVITIKRALDLTRLILISHEYFKLSQAWQASEFEYYAYRFRNYFKHIAWFTAFSVKVKSNPLLNDFIDSLSTRFELWCRAVDRARIHSMRGSKVDKFQNTLYDFNYYVLLTTGMFENLAWIINYAYGLGFNRDIARDRIKIGIRWTDPQNRIFLNKLGSNELNNFICESENQAVLDLFYALRNEVAHNLVGDGHTTTDQSIFGNQTRIKIPEKAIDLLKSRTKEKHWGLNPTSLFPSDRDSIAVHTFCEYSSEYLRRFFNSAMGQLRKQLAASIADKSTDREIGKFTTELKTHISRNSFMQAEPYYFCPEMFFDNCY